MPRPTGTMYWLLMDELREQCVRAGLTVPVDCDTALAVALDAAAAVHHTAKVVYAIGDDTAHDLVDAVQHIARCSGAESDRLATMERHADEIYRAWMLHFGAFVTNDPIATERSKTAVLAALAGWAARYGTEAKWLDHVDPSQREAVRQAAVMSEP
jgi:hypothetical protein